MLRIKGNRGTKTSPFIAKLSDMLEDSHNHHLISWTEEEKSFVVKHPHAFSSTLLPKYFRHKNYSSFLRQLSHYNFNKLRTNNQSEHLFQHPLFSRGQFQNHRKIKRTDQNREISNPKDSQSSIFDIFCLSDNFKQQPVSLDKKITQLSYSQRQLKQQCQKIINSNKDIMIQNYILKATIEDESVSHRIILDRIQSFMMRHCQSDLNYCDSNKIKDLLSFLENNSWEMLMGAKPTATLREFVNIVESNELKVVFKWISSFLTNDYKKKKSYTIIGKQNQLKDYKDYKDYSLLRLADYSIQSQYQD